MDADFSGWLVDLGAGAAFASRKVLGQELAVAQVTDIKVDVRRDVLVFDWWVRNADRCLTVPGGNVNLLWQPIGLIRDDDDARVGSGQLAVIDHNLAFDDTFSAKDFCQTHVFAGDIAETFSDFVLRAEYQSRLSVALAGLEATWNNVPADWHFVDVEQTIPTEYAKADIWALLHRCAASEFWNLPT